MSLSDQERQTIVSMELEKAQRTFSDMEFCANEQKWEAAANRLYYALFHAVSALLISGGHNIKSHRGTLSTMENLNSYLILLTSYLLILTS